MFYAARGNIPPKRHTQHRASDGSLYAEELFGVEGFTGRSSLLYHLVPPTRTHRIEPAGEIVIEEADDGYHHHRLIDAVGVEPTGDAVTGRIPLFFNSDVVMGVVRPATEMPDGTFYRNGAADEMLFVHEGEGLMHTVFGPLRYGPGDYLVLPIGTTWRLDPDAGSAQRMLYLECPSEIEPPKRYRNDYGQLLEHSPYSQRDIRLPAAVPPRTDGGEFQVLVKMRDRLTAYHYAHHPFDVVGWDGYLWPFAFNIGDFEPITGRVHQPPPVHQTFAARNFVVCSFVPRKFDYHPLAIPAPYNHSNINSDEVIYYVAGNFMSRRGRGDQLVHAASGRDPARAASGDGGGIDRQGGDRRAGRDGRHVPSAEDHEAGGRPRGRPLSVFVAARRGRLRRGTRTQRARAGGVPGLIGTPALPSRRTGTMRASDRRSLVRSRSTGRPRQG